MGVTQFLLLADQGAVFVSGLLNVLSIIIGVCGTLMIVYGVYIFFLMATATDEGKRRAAKNRIFKVLSSILIVVALVMILQSINVVIDGNIDASKNGGGMGDPEGFTDGASLNAPDFKINCMSEQGGFSFQGSATFMPNCVKLNTGRAKIVSIDSITIVNPTSDLELDCSKPDNKGIMTVTYTSKDVSNPPQIKVSSGKVYVMVGFSFQVDNEEELREGSVGGNMPVMMASGGPNNAPNIIVSV